MNRTVIACQEADVSGTADNIAEWRHRLAVDPEHRPPQRTRSTRSTSSSRDPANANVRVLQPNTFFSFDSDTAAGTVTIVDAAGATVAIGSR